MDQLSGVEVHLKLSRELLDVPFSSMMAGWTNSICKQVRYKSPALSRHEDGAASSACALASQFQQLPGVLTTFACVSVTVPRSLF